MIDANGSLISVVFKGRGYTFLDNKLYTHWSSRIQARTNLTCRKIVNDFVSKILEESESDEFDW